MFVNVTFNKQQYLINSFYLLKGYTAQKLLTSWPGFQGQDIFEVKNGAS